jgi:CubicO group peptidase (beta-lactamase class C family)
MMVALGALICAGVPASAGSTAFGSDPADGDAVGRTVRILATTLRSARVPAATYAVVRDGQVSVGTHGSGIREDTPFVLGSVSKSVTAVAVLQLVEVGAVDLEARVTRYLPWLSTADATAVPTIRQLLEQTSGWPTSAGTADVAAGPRSLERRVRGLAGVQPTAPPGARFQYCNLNYAALGLVVETVAGEPYAEYVQRHVFDPLEMRHSYTSLSRARAAGLPAGTTPWWGVNVRSSPEAFPGALPDGYLISTAPDLGHYLQMLLDRGTYRGRRVLAARWVDAMQAPAHRTDPDVAAPGTDTYGMGLAGGEVNHRRLVAHQGDVAGFHTDLGLLPAEHRGLVVLTARNGALIDNSGPYLAGLRTLAGETGVPAGQSFVRTYLAFDTCCAALGAGLATRCVAVVRRRRPPLLRHRTWRRALLSVAGSLLLSASWILAVVVGLGTATQGAPLQPALVLAFAPEIFVIGCVVAGYPLVVSVLRLVHRARWERHELNRAPGR